MSHNRPLISSDTARFRFYDIESLSNVFTVCVYDTVDKNVDVFILNDNKDNLLPLEAHHDTVREHIIAGNPAWIALLDGAQPRINIFDLSTPEHRDMLIYRLGGLSYAEDLHSAQTTRKDHTADGLLAPTNTYCTTSGMSVNKLIITPDTLLPGSLTQEEQTYERIPYDANTHPFITGYNSFNYDTVMLALYFDQAIKAQDNQTHIPTAQQLRFHNDMLFDQKYIEYMPRYLYSDGNDGARTLRDNMLASGRHLDIAKLNELQFRVGLKRLAGQAGHQILESTSLGSNKPIRTIDELIDLIVYNVSDVIATALVFNDPVYRAGFDLRAALIHAYPETVYSHTGDYATCVVDREHVRPATGNNKRLCFDDTSAKFTNCILSPYRPLREIPAHVADRVGVSFLYPERSVAKKLGIKFSNVLEDVRDRFYESIPDTSPDGQAARSKFDEVYQFYRSIEAKNFNNNNPAPAYIAHIPVTLKQTLDSMLLDVNATVLPDPAHKTHADDIEQLIQHLGSTFKHISNMPSNITTNSVHHYINYDTVLAWCGLYVNDTTATSDYEHDLIDLFNRHMELGLITPASKKTKADLLDAIRDTKLLAQFLALQAHINGLSFAQIAAEKQRNNNDPLCHSVPWPPQDMTDVYALNTIQRRDTNIPYYYVDDNGNVTDSGCFATFSTGGLHGAEYNQQKYLADTHKLQQQQQVIADVMQQCLRDMTNPADSVNTIRRVRFEQGDVKRYTPLSDKQAHDLCWYAEELTRSHSDERQRAAAWLRTAKHVVVNNTLFAWSDVLKVDPKNKNAAPTWRTVPKGTSSAKQKPLFKPSTQGSSIPSHNGLPHENTVLNNVYATTSVAKTNHEDFKSYYPLLLTNLAAFDNPDLHAAGLSADRYTDLYHQKEEFGKKMKDTTLSQQERDYFAIQREGVKLILNSASGAADATYDNNIRMNNTIISMRIIGQLLTFLVGHTQTQAGGRIVSTNTDGLYSVLDEETNNNILTELTPVINVDIEPEPMVLISKDSNNRIELDAHPSYVNPFDRKVLAASGSSLAAHKGPTMRKSLSHAAVVDYTLAQYFKLMVNNIVDDIPHGYTPVGHNEAISITSPMYEPAVRGIIATMTHKYPINEYLRFFQHMLVSSPGKNTFLFSTPVGDTPADYDPCPNELIHNQWGDKEYTLLGHYSRAFFVDADKLADHPTLKPVFIGSAKPMLVQPKVLQTRKRKAQEIGSVVFNTKKKPAVDLLTQAGVDVHALSYNHDIGLYKHNGVATDQPVVIFNGSLNHPRDPQVLYDLAQCLDIDAYVKIIIDTFEKNWRVKP